MCFPRWENPFLSTTQALEDTEDSCLSSHYGKWRRQLFCRQCMQQKMNGQNGPKLDRTALLISIEILKISYLTKFAPS